MTVSFHTWTSPPLLQLLPCSGPHVVVLKWARRPRRRVPVSHTVPALAAAAPRTAVGLMLSNSPQLGFTLCLPACFGFNDFIAFQVSHPSLLTRNSLKVISNPIYKRPQVTMSVTYILCKPNPRNTDRQRQWDYCSGSKAWLINETRV